MDGRSYKPTLWFDVEDLLRYVTVHRRPSGIQRLSFQIYQAFTEMADNPFAIGFVRHASHNQFRVVEWAQVKGLFDVVEETANLVHAASHAAGQRSLDAKSLPVTPETDGADPLIGTDAASSDLTDRAVLPRRFAQLRRVSRRLPDRFRRPALQCAAMQVQAGIALGQTIGVTLKGAVARMHRQPKPGPIIVPPPDEPEADILLGHVAQRGDVLASIGSPWFDEDYATRMSHARSRLGMQIAVLVYDMIPVNQPQWCHRGTIRVFQNYYSTVLPLADTIFAISHTTARDLLAWCRKKDVTLIAEPVVIPVGSGFKNQMNPVTGSGAPTIMDGSRRYVLFVSTIEIRKNHILLFRVWRRLLETMPRDAVPELVFVGAEGWLVRDFMQQVENSRWLDGKLRIIRDADDNDLVALYKGCMFTVFPSFYEGWGLPVTEALRFGKPCIAAGVSSIPEAGGNLARYFDPGSLDDAVRTIRHAIEDEAGLADWTREVEEGFRPVPWTQTAQTMARTLNRATAT